MLIKNDLIWATGKITDSDRGRDQMIDCTHF